MSQLFVDDVVSKEGTNSVGFSKGISVSVASTFSGNVSIAGTLTYEDVTSVDVVGLITARGGIKLGAAGIGGTFNANGDTTLAGVVTASSFVGDGSGLTNLVGTGVTNNVNTVNLNVISGVSTFNNNVTLAAGNLDVDAGQLLVGSNVLIGPAGVATFSGTGDVHLKDSVKLLLGTASGGDCQLIHDGSDTFVQNKTGDFKIANNVGGDVGGNIIIQAMNGENSINCVHDAQVELSHNGTKKFETTSSGTITTGISTVTVGTDLKGFKVESGNYSGGALNGEFDFTLEDGHVWTVVGSTGGTYFPDFKVSSSKSLSSIMNVGDTVTATLIAAASNTAHYCTAGIKIDDSTSNVTVEWIGSSAPSAGKGAGYDIYTFTIVKTAATPGYLVIVNATDAG